MQPRGKRKEGSGLKVNQASVTFIYIHRRLKKADFPGSERQNKVTEKIVRKEA